MTTALIMNTAVAAQIKLLMEAAVAKNAGPADIDSLIAEHFPVDAVVNTDEHFMAFGRVSDCEDSMFAIKADSAEQAESAFKAHMYDEEGISFDDYESKDDIPEVYIESLCTIEQMFNNRIYASK
jgi:hypothetical protein